MKAEGSFLTRMQRSLLSALLIMPLIAIGIGSVTVAWAQAASAARPKSSSLRTPDFDATLSWYQDKLGFRLIADRSFVSGRQAVLERGGFLLEVSEVDHVLTEAQDPHATSAVPVTRVPVISVLVPDVDAEVAKLEAKGVDILQVPEDDIQSNYRVAQIRDNGRHRIELREPLGDPGGFNATGR